MGQVPISLVMIFGTSTEVEFAADLLENVFQGLEIALADDRNACFRQQGGANALPNAVWRFRARTRIYHLRPARGADVHQDRKSHVGFPGNSKHLTRGNDHTVGPVFAFLRKNPRMASENVKPIAAMDVAKRPRRPDHAGECVIVA